MELALQIGDPLQLQSLQGDVRPRLSCKLIGMQAPLSLMISEPRDGDRPVFVREGQVFAVRLFDGGRACAFTARVLRSCVHPYPYVHLSYPADVEHVVVRRSRRLHVDLPASILNEHPERRSDRPALLVDISLTGAMVQAQAGLGESGDPLVVRVNLKVEGFTEHGALLPSLLRQVHAGGTGEIPAASCRYGLEFRELEAQAAMRLRAYVYAQMLGATETRAA